MRVEKINLTKEKLLKIKKIDDSFYINDKLNIDWYTERYKEFHNGYLLINEKEEAVGYIIVVPVKKELYDAIISGVLVNDIHINPNMFIERSNYHYLSSFVLKKEYRHQNYGLLLINELAKDVKGNICCLAVSEDGNHKAEEYMNLKEKLNDKVSVFEIKIN